MGFSAKRFLATVVGLLVVVLIGAGWLLRRHGLVSDRAPGRVETAIARRLVVLSIPASTRQLRNPYAGDAAAWHEGANHFQEHCAVCHGVDGHGSDIAHKMYPPVPDLASPAIQRMSDGALFAIIRNGVSWTGMPAFRTDYSEQDTWKVVAFVRHLPLLKPGELHAGSGAAHPESTPTAPTVAMDGTAFTPATLTVDVGDTVTWVNNDPFPHNVTSAAGRFHSPDLAPGSRWTFIARTAGRFDYVCTLHPGMRGTLIVRQQTSKRSIE